jgi:glutamate-5-semialdehyde dehydrogenase
MTVNPLNDLGRNARTGAGILAALSADAKNAALQSVRKGLQDSAADILAANAQDVAKNPQLDAAMRDRLALDAKRFDAILSGIDTIIALPDPVGRDLGDATRPNGLLIRKVAVPLGVVGVIFESRPNVAIDAATLCFKSGNACILRGGSESAGTVALMVKAMQDALVSCGLPASLIQVLPNQDRALVTAMLQLDQYIDVIVPRGGKSLVSVVREQSRVPVFSHLDGICHTYIDVAADADKALSITLNAKLRRTGICGATECLLLHKDIAQDLGLSICKALADKGCEVRVPADLLQDDRFKQAQDSDYGHEFLAPIIAVKIVDDVAAAIAHVNAYGSGHTDAIITEDTDAAELFLSRVASAIALHNASTQFADGGEFGMGAEIGIATGKMHARGPVGLNELTTYQYRVYGTGQTRA